MDRDSSWLMVNKPRDPNDKSSRSILTSPEVIMFVEQMQFELLDNKRKGEWRDFTDPEKILSELRWHEAKLQVAMRDESDPEKLKELIADCANCLLFLRNALDLNL
ncbi:hypothetical protein Molly5_182 [Maribacter phage Molly_5]|uniref:Uncharacterized protein n=1 Tax=Maribacter phage Molly_1 TaxID=2745685 RepID=A0A8E4UYD6_9CAUD|nr:hypothetical protein M1M29_gp182 [Maribacter phage Molly_1]QQO97680.1 hypothetical protein Molly2_182 [Maribacter phage Molly_2]QQO97880.1 hypothetical protein Molly3_182 [Maribacter phage Molly_3]QQO98080.1 hypothetical protein Molly4_182 [Maribacter phage Molly_4]QQO98280.1 hypothetical protein Molly5_182 [Maribacter phage Molly_5]QQO97480.1 hypothetical protein Molly1_182 [Maribacter phage Molly_1]